MTIDVGGGLTMGCLVTCGGDKYLTVDCLAPRTNVINMMIFDGEDDKQKTSHSGLLGVDVPLPKTEHPGLESRPATESATLRNHDG